MKNQLIIDIFNKIADILEILGENPFKPIAYRKAVRSIEALGMDIEDFLKEHHLSEIPGVGKAMQEKISEILETGELQYLKRLEEKVPDGLLQILAIPGVGPKKTALFYKKLGIKTIEELKQACIQHRLRDLKGLGPKLEENILRAIENLDLEHKRILLHRALQHANGIVEYLKRHKDVIRISPAGSVRRWKETIGDIDILVSAKVSQGIMDMVVNYEDVKEVIAKGETKTSIILRDGVQVDVRVVNDDSFGSALQYFTGSKEHNVKLRTLARKKGLKINEYGVFKQEDDTPVPGAGKEEEKTYAAVGLPYIPPELREDTGEIEAALEGRLPVLVERKDIKGDLHIHSNWSDGRNSIEEIAVFARDVFGYEYIAIADHSESERIGNGLNRERRLAQIKEIENLNDSIDGIKIFKSIEVNILPDGSLDASEDVLEKLDFAVAAVHSQFKMVRKEMTERVVAALQHPKVKMLAHPFARRIYQREPIELDFEKVVETAVSNKVAIEINSCPDRLDLDWSRVKKAREDGVLFAVCTDAHNLPSLEMISLGLSVARRGWLEKRHVLNTMPLKEVEKWLKE
ncbi:MAG TPA: DNA polymerase/3'-5' exonuclease PolX [Thermoplasmata archaeon]|nr:DNA polymerase/3'-5' exonuclease PolX [Thermoplasmata archaeon]